MILDQFCLKGKIALVTGANDAWPRPLRWGWRKPERISAAVYRSDITKTQELVEALGRRFFAVPGGSVPNGIGGKGLQRGDGALRPD